jgi:hypothetical protein
LLWPTAPRIISKAPLLLRRAAAFLCAASPEFAFDGQEAPPGSEAAASAPRNSLLQAIGFAVFSLLDPGFAAQRLMELEVSNGAGEKSHERLVQRTATATATGDTRGAGTAEPGRASHSRAGTPRFTEYVHAVPPFPKPIWLCGLSTARLRWTRLRAMRRSLTELSRRTEQQGSATKGSTRLQLRLHAPI